MIRLVQTRLRRRFVVGVNLEEEREAIGVRSGTDLVYPDLVLTSTTGARRLHGVAEIETAESVNRLEAMAEWVHFGKVRGAFYLYVPAGATDVTLQLCEEYGIAITEIWSYLAVGDQMRFTMTYRSARAARQAVLSSNAKTVKRTLPTRKRKTTPAKRTTKSATRTTKSATRTAKPVKRAAKPAKRAAKPAKRAAKPAKRAAKPAKRAAKPAKRGAGTKKAAKGARRQGSSGRKTSSRASTSPARSASQARRRSTGAGTKKTTTFRRSRKHR